MCCKCVADLRIYGFTDLRITECSEEKNRKKTVVLTAHKAENTKTKTVYFY